MPSLVKTGKRILGCFAPGTLVRTDRGYKPIETILIGDKVLTSKGRYKTVTKTFERPFNGELLSVRPSVSTNTILVTSDHPFLALQGSHSPKGGCCPGYCNRHIDRGDGNTRRMNSGVHKVESGKWTARAQILGTRTTIGTYPTQRGAIEAVKLFKEENIEKGHLIGWEEARNLTEQSWLVAKWPVEIQDVNQICIPKEITTNSSRSYRRKGPTTFKVDEEFLWVVGLYLAEGSPSRSGIIFSLHAKETEYHERLLKYFKGIGFNATVYFHKTRINSADVLVFGVNLAQWFPLWLGSGCSNKTIPEEFMQLPAKKTWSLLRGIFDGDGSKSRNRIGQTSEILALQMAELLHRVGEQPSLHTHRSKIPTLAGNRLKPVYRLSWAEDTLNRKHRASRWVFQKEKLTRVKKVDRVPYEGLVYNLEVQEDRTYVVNGVTVHNCDPGKVNFGWAVYGDSGLEDHGVMEGIDSVHRLPAFSEHFANLFYVQNPDVCCIERYRLRPGKGSSLNMELVNLMIGCVWAFCKSEWVECHLVDPSAHKTWTSRNFEVGLSTRKIKGIVKKKYDLRTYSEWQGLPTEHEVDAANVAKYGHDYLLVKE